MKYTAQITTDYETMDYEIEDVESQFQTPQEFHKHLILKELGEKEEILSITDETGKLVFYLLDFLYKKS